MTRLSLGRVLLWAMLLLGSAGCSSSHSRNQAGGETHFMSACLDGECEGDLACVCGVCTKACEESSECSALGAGATCNALEPDSLLCGDNAPDDSRVCDVRCERTSDCDALGESFECVEGRCRPEAIAGALAGGMDAAVADGSTSDGPVAPLVIILLDTSGSMERTVGCACTSPSCVECLPDCEADPPVKNRWAHALEALTGSYESFACEAVARSGPEFTYDLDYLSPYHQPSGDQRKDGVMYELGSMLRFGLATFDSIATYDPERQRTIDELDFDSVASAAGLWSYPPAASASEVYERSNGHAVGSYHFPLSELDYVMNTGIRNGDADSGGLRIDHGRRPSLDNVNAIEESLRAVRPYGSTPIAAALDDLYWLYTRDAAMEAERLDPERERHLVLITDGRPDDDFRTQGCDCNEDGDGSDCEGMPFEDPSAMHCPYPTSEDAISALRCSDPMVCDSPPFHSVHVIGFDVADAMGRAKLDALALTAGHLQAAHVSDGEELREELVAILINIANRNYIQDLERSPCAPQRVEGRGTCEVLFGYYWNGFTCADLGGCDCAGPDCGSVYESEEDCVAAHAQCGEDRPRACGGFSFGQCRSGEYCEMLPEAACGRLDEDGTCQPQPSGCDGNYEPVCGCDGEEYGNACEAARAGAGLASFGACEDAP